MCVCVRERERERVCVCVCVCERERERESVCECVCVCVDKSRCSVDPKLEQVRTGRGIKAELLETNQLKVCCNTMLRYLETNISC